MSPTIGAQLAHLLIKASKAGSLKFAYQGVVPWFIKTYPLSIV